MSTRTGYKSNPIPSTMAASGPDELPVMAAARVRAAEDMRERRDKEAQEASSARSPRKPLIGSVSVADLFVPMLGDEERCAHCHAAQDTHTNGRCP